jgi:hypothetical protein
MICESKNSTCRYASSDAESWEHTYYELPNLGENLPGARCDFNLDDWNVFVKGCSQPVTRDITPLSEPSGRIVRKTGYVIFQAIQFPD